jgi:hypothetical protein
LTWTPNSFGEYCFNTEKDGSQLPEALDLSIAIESGKDHRLHLDGYSYTLSPISTKKFLNRRKEKSGSPDSGTVLRQEEPPKGASQP